MKLRFRSNSLRLRLNRREVERLSAGAVLKEEVHFPGDGMIAYILESAPHSSPEASFHEGTIRIAAPRNQVENWAAGDSIGIYFDLPANGVVLRVAVEKDLECVDGPPEERDPDAFPRADPTHAESRVKC